MQSAEEELAALLAAGIADDAEDFRRRARQHEERLDLERRRDEHRRNLEWFSGPGQRFDAFREALARPTPTGWARSRPGFRSFTLKWMSSAACCERNGAA